jgi:hypothetical protein
VAHPLEAVVELLGEEDLLPVAMDFMATTMDLLEVVVDIPKVTMDPLEQEDPWWRKCAYMRTLAEIFLEPMVSILVSNTYYYCPNYPS